MLKSSKFVKIRVVAPTTHGNIVRKALAEAGAGVQGKYANCSFSYPVKGKFRPLKGAKPAIGVINRLETVDEEVVEVICEDRLVKKAIIAVKKVHPYEEPAIDIMPRFNVE